MDHFQSADPKLQNNEAILWNRIKKRPDLSIVNTITDAVPMLKSNPFAVLYSQEMMIQLRIEEYPCKIITTSKTLRKVKLNCSND
jgi:hypothetical protein